MLVNLKDRGSLVFQADVHTLKLSTSVIIYTRSARSPVYNSGSVPRVSKALQEGAHSGTVETAESSNATRTKPHIPMGRKSRGLVRVVTGKSIEQ